MIINITAFHTEEYLDQIIACANQMLAVWLQTLKETGARPIEAWKIERDDFDVDTKKLVYRILQRAATRGS